MQDPISALPVRLRRALHAWLGLSMCVALLPAAATESLGLLAHPGFWCGLLPLLALGPTLASQLRERARRRRPAPRKRSRRQARRRVAQGAAGARFSAPAVLRNR